MASLLAQQTFIWQDEEEGSVHAQFFRSMTKSPAPMAPLLWCVLHRMQHRK